METQHQEPEQCVSCCSFQFPWEAPVTIHNHVSVYTYVMLAFGMAIPS